MTGADTVGALGPRIAFLLLAWFVVTRYLWSHL
jgi:hypothetical protein